MRRRLTIGLIVVIIIAIIIGITINLLNNSNDEISGNKLIKVNEVTRSVFYAPQYVAISNGYFGKYGIDVELTTGQGADAVMTSVLANECEIGFAGPEASIYVYNEGKEDYIEVFA